MYVKALDKSTEYWMLHEQVMKMAWHKVVFVSLCMCKESENIKNCIYKQIKSSSYIYLHQRDWQEFMTYRYKLKFNYF